MAEIMMTRIDFRLVHGQVAGTWIKHLGASNIVVLCDEVGNDPFMIEMYKLAAPAGCDITAYTVAEGCRRYSEGKWDEGKTIVLFKYAAEALRAYKTGFEFQSINLGQVPKSPERKQVSNSVYISKDELDSLRQLAALGVDVYLQPIPFEDKMPLEDAVSKLSFD